MKFQFQAAPENDHPNRIIIMIGSLNYFIITLQVYEVMFLEGIVFISITKFM